MKLKSAKAFVQEVAIILIGCFLTAFAVDCILKPSGLAVTGVTGVAMVLEHWFGINYTYTNYLFTLMIAVATYFLLGKKEFFRILALSIIYPVILVIFNHFSFQLIYDDLPLTCITFSTWIFLRRFRYVGKNFVCQVKGQDHHWASHPSVGWLGDPAIRLCSGPKGNPLHADLSGLVRKSHGTGNDGFSGIFVSSGNHQLTKQRDPVLYSPSVEQRGNFAEDSGRVFRHRIF